MPSRWVATLGRPLVIAHRGANREAPENTLRAFDRAKELGADGIELDVLLDADGRARVCHDAVLSRLTRGRNTQRLRTLGEAQLRSVDLGQGQTVPSLDSVLEWATKARMLVNVELKSDQGERSALAHAVAQSVGSFRDASEWVLASSFDPELLARFHRLAPHIRCGKLLESSRTWVGRTWLAVAGELFWPPVSAVHPGRDLVHVESVARWKRQGLRIHPWTVNDPNLARQFAALGVDALITDEPAKILTALGQS